MNRRPFTTRRPAGCIYTIGLLSGIIVLVLCGSMPILSIPHQTPPGGVDRSSFTSIASSPPAAELPWRATLELFQVADGYWAVVRLTQASPATQVWVSIWSGIRQLGGPLAVVTDEAGMATAEFVLEGNQPLSSPALMASVGTQDQPLYLTVEATLSPDTPLPPRECSSALCSPTPTVPICTLTSTPPPSRTSTPTREPTPTPTNTGTPTTTPEPTAVQPNVQFPNWRAEYFANPNFAGEPALTRDDPRISFDWGSGSPAHGIIGTDRFSVRWSRHVSLPSGHYTFVLDADDSADVWINGERVIQYVLPNSKPATVQRYMPTAEAYDIEVKFVERRGDAHIRFYWLPTVSHGCWQALYYQSADLTGPMVFYEELEGINILKDWTDGAERLPVIGDKPFSVHFSRQLLAVPLPTENYLLCIYTDDGIRVWVNRSQVAGHWARNNPQWHFPAPQFGCVPVFLSARD